MQKKEQKLKTITRIYVFNLVHVYTHTQTRRHRAPRDEIDVVCLCVYTKIFSTHLILVPILRAAAARVGPISLNSQQARAGLYA